MSRRGGKKRRNDEGNGERRKSPRFCVSVSSPHQKGEINRNKQCKKDGLSTASLKPHNQVAENLIDSARPTVNESWIPDKQILEQVLDTLQRRDTHEIFAEPVDPSEVEEYYEIIKEPMDFGTMRAKLHEGMYKTLQQFERDVFLIFDNAIHFNSSTTVYFRQARALEELAKRIFHVLRTDIKNFEVEFVITKRRSCRGVVNNCGDQSKALSFGASQKVDKDLQSNTTNTNLGRRGYRKERMSFVTEMDRRSTYEPWRLIDDNFSPIHHSQKSLIQVNDGEEIGYKKSLMLFVKDLGPTAQRVAKRKLQELHIQIPTNPNKSNIKPVKQALGFSRFLDVDNDKNNTKIRGFSDFTLQNGNNLVGKFDLNQVVQSASSDSSPSTIGGCSFKDDETMSNSGAFSSFPMQGGQFTFDLPYLQSRMREVNNNVNEIRYYYSRMGTRNNVPWYV